MNKNLSAAIANLRTLSVEELRVLNHEVCDQIKSRARELSFDFKIGDRIKFEKKGITHYVRIEGFNRARTMAKGPEVNADGSPRTNFPMRWQVSCNSMTKVA